MSSDLSSKIIGNQFRIETIEVARHDFSDEMNRQEASEACESLGEGWRLPSKEELNILYQNKKKIGGFAKEIYWSSSEHTKADSGWAYNFANGHEFYNYKVLTYKVRAVRSF